jgi:hypothetical protein
MLLFCNSLDKVKVCWSQKVVKNYKIDNHFNSTIFSLCPQIEPLMFWTAIESSTHCATIAGKDDI